MSEEWKSFLYPADEWLVCYASTPRSCHSVQFFAAGHALELYLKAIHCRIVGDIQRSMKHGHNLVPLWTEIKSADPAFAPSFDIRPAVLAIKALKGGYEKVLSVDDMKHYISYQELYMVMQHLADLKYLGAPLKSVSGTIGFAFSFPNPMWITLFVELRSYIGKGNVQDWIEYWIAQGDVSTTAASLLEPIVNTWRA